MRNFVEMADVDSYTYTTTKVRKTRKTTTSKRRESTDGGTDVTITEVTEKENHIPSLTNGIPRKERYLLAFFMYVWLESKRAGVLF